ncbi:uncharacterized protein [Diadema antillarum]|uniref:uncharacterized protein n=1 Tax=Diadema antillarum TaxID=105358 RepID=UPI003A8C45B0
MASAAGSQSQSKKSKSKKKTKNPVVSTPNTISYGPPQPVLSQPGPFPGTHAQPLPAGVVYSTPPGIQPAVYPVYPAPPMVIQGPITPGMPMVPGGVPVVPQVPQRSATMTSSRQSQRQLDFTQAMADFQRMFPSMDREVIETVLRSNNGKVDETIDQLLALSADAPSGPPRPPPMHTMSMSQPIPPSQLPPEFIPPDAMAEPPPYTPPEPDSPFSRFSTRASSPPTQPAPPRQTTTPVSGSSEPNYERTVRQMPPNLPPPRMTHSWSAEDAETALRANESNAAMRTDWSNSSRQWNPPVVGNLPSDFLRLSVSGSTPPTSQAPTRAPEPSPQQQTPQPRVARGIQARLDQNSMRQRSIHHGDATSAQMLEDERIALLLQNEEFLQRLQSNPEFMSALERDYQDSLRDGDVQNGTSHETATPPSRTTPLPAPPQNRASTPPNMANRPLPSTPGPELPARPPSMRRDSSGASLPPPPSPGPGLSNGSSGPSDGVSGGSGGAASPDDIEFRKKLNYMGKSSKTKLSILAGFYKKKKPSKKYASDAGGATDALLQESIYEELREDSPLTRQKSIAGDNIYHEVGKSSKKRHSLGQHDPLLRYDDNDPHYFSR